MCDYNEFLRPKERKRERTSVTLKQKSLEEEEHLVVSLYVRAFSLNSESPVSLLRFCSELMPVYQ